MKKCNVNCPFGPLIYTADISGEFHQFLLNGLDDCRKSKDVKNQLVGNIDQQRAGAYSLQKFNNFLYPHLISYLQEKNNRHRSVTDMCNGDEIVWDASKSEINFGLGGGPWVNFQKKGECNPLHNHTGILSAVVFIKIPKEIEEERKNSDYIWKTAGCLEFVYNNQHIIVNPREAMMYLFPAYLLHAVYPYHSDVERISMSFNFTHILIDNNNLPDHLMQY